MRSGKGWIPAPSLQVTQGHCMQLSSPGLALPSHQVLTASGRDLEFLLQDCSWHFLREPLEPWRWQITAGRSSQNGQQQLLWVQVYRYDAVCQEHWPPKKHWKQRFFFFTCKHCMQCQRIYFKDKAVTLSEVVSTMAFMVVFFFP